MMRNYDRPTRSVHSYLQGQRVIVNGRFIGIVEEAKTSATRSEVFVRNAVSGLACWYEDKNVRPLPNGQV